MTDHARRPRVGLVALAFPGYYLGEEMAAAKYAEMQQSLAGCPLEVVALPQVILANSAARQAGEQLSRANVDLICVVLTTFVPDHDIVALLEGCDRPIFLWAIEREIHCLALVGGMLINPTLYDLGKAHQLEGADIGDVRALASLLAYARAAMVQRCLQRMRVGVLGAAPDIMLSMAVDEYGLKRVLGVTLVPLRDLDYVQRQAAVPEAVAQADWVAVQGAVGHVQASTADALAASRLFLAAKQWAEELRLDALSLNCWTPFKSKICLPIARLNDVGLSLNHAAKSA